MKALDHSRTYRELSFRNIPHIVRIRHILTLVRRQRFEKGVVSYLDVGCSNGFITSAIERELKPARVTGLDHNKENLEVAKLTHPHINFGFVDLNRVGVVDGGYGLITCFETLEHVGDIEAALKNIFLFADKHATIIISVPIEIGFRGIFKFLIKTVFFGYRLDELPGDVKWHDYLFKLIRGERISIFRDRRAGWGNHFGFDYRDVDDVVDRMAQSAIKYSSFTTRFYVIPVH